VLSSHYRNPLTFSDEALEAAESGAERLRQVTYGGYASGAKKAKINTETYRDRFIEVMDDDFGTPQALATLFDLAREINRADEAGYEAKGARGALKELAGILGLTLERQEQTFETSLYNEFRNFYKHKNYDEAIEYYTNAIKRLDNNKRIYTHLSTSLCNQFVHGTYPSLDKAAESTQIYSHTLKSLRDQMARRNFEEALESLSTISSSATTNTSEYISLRNQLRETKQWQLADKIRSRLEETGIALEDTPKGTLWRRKC
jgi:cysteinyl-tRNA synthetase